MIQMMLQIRNFGFITGNPWSLLAEVYPTLVGTSMLLNKSHLSHIIQTCCRILWNKKRIIIWSLITCCSQIMDSVGHFVFEIPALNLLSSEMLLHSWLAPLGNFASHHVSNVTIDVGIAEVQRKGSGQMRQSSIKFRKGILSLEKRTEWISNEALRSEQNRQNFSKALTRCFVHCLQRF